MNWFGADPGGRRDGMPAFGVALLRENGTFDTTCRDSARDAFDWMLGTEEQISFLGVDCPLWWSAGRSGERQVDLSLRRRYSDRIGSSVMAINSLQGAALVQGTMLAYLVRQQNAHTKITETHPKALLKAMRLISGKSFSFNEDWLILSEKFGLVGAPPPTFDEVDALLSAAAAREFYTGRWNCNLITLPRTPNEIDPAEMFFGSVDYGWFEAIV